MVDSWTNVGISLVQLRFFFKWNVRISADFFSSNYDAIIVELGLEQPNFDSMV